MREGSKVVCVDDRFPVEIFIHYSQLPIKNKVYTVRGMGIGISTTGEMGEVVVYLSELKNPCSNKPPHPERGFAQWRFRELEPLTDEEIENIAEFEEAIGL